MALANPDVSSRWPDGTIPYEISDDFTEEQKDVIISAIRYYHTYTLIRWVRRGTQSDYVRFQPHEERCTSRVGMEGDEQFISCNIGNGFDQGSVLHEMLHAFGYHHEQNRPDRDDFVIVNFDNIEEDREHNFEIVEDGLMLTPYDYDSIMHYRRGGFAIDSSIDTITPLDPTADIGGKDVLSDFDHKGICAIYNAPHFSVAFQSDKNSDGKSLVYWSGLTNWGAVCRGPIPVGDIDTADQKDPCVGMDAERNAVIAWADDAANNGNYRIKVRCFASVLVGFNPIIASTNLSARNEYPTIAVRDNGDFVIAWQERLNGSQRILARGFTNAGSQRFDPIVVDDGTDGTPAVPNIDFDAEGNFIITWSRLQNESISVHVRGFTMDGQNAMSTIEVDNHLGDIIVHPRVAVADDGRFYVVYDYRLREIKIVGYQPDGTILFNSIIANQDEDGPQYFGDVAIVENSSLVVVWTDDRNENNMGQIRARTFTLDGEATQDDQTINTRGGGDQRHPKVDIDQDGNILVAFEDDVDRNGKYQTHVEIYSDIRRHKGGPFTINTIWKGQQINPSIGAV